MREVGAFEAKNTLGALRDRVQQGEEIVITRHGKPVARLILEVGAADLRARARRAAEEIQRLSQGVRLGEISLKPLIEDGRP